MLVIVGSSDLWVTPDIVAITLAKIVATPPIVPLGVRVPRGSDEPTSMLEQFVAKLGPDLGRVVQRCRADTNKRDAVYRRDYNMVEQAIGVLAFFAPDQEMEGGTGHVVQAALARSIPVDAYRMDETGHPELLGSDDGGLYPYDPGFQPQWPPTPVIYKGTGTITTTGTTTGNYTGGWTFSFDELGDTSTNPFIHKVTGTWKP